MIARTACLAAAIACVATRASAGPIADASVVRSIEQTAANHSRLTLDVERPAVEQYLRTALGGLFSGVQVQQVTVGGNPGSSALEITVQFEVARRIGALDIRLAGGVAGRVLLDAGAGNTVGVRLFIDSLSFGGKVTPLNGVEVVAARRQVALPVFDGAIQRIALVSIDASWISVSVDVGEGG